MGCTVDYSAPSCEPSLDNEFTASCATSAQYVDVRLLLHKPKLALLPIIREVSEAWAQLDCEAIVPRQLSGAMTNLDKLVLVRVVASEEELFDRAAELRTFLVAAAAGVGAAPLLVFGNGRVEEWLGDYTVINASSLREPAMSAHIAQALANFHCSMTYSFAGTSASTSADAKQSDFWSRMLGWLDMAEKLWKDDQERSAQLAAIRTQVRELERTLHTFAPSCAAFCHNDLQYGNIMGLNTAPKFPSAFSGAEAFAPTVASLSITGHIPPSASTSGALAVLVSSSDGPLVRHVSSKELKEQGSHSPSCLAYSNSLASASGEHCSSPSGGDIWAKKPPAAQLLGSSPPAGHSGHSSVSSKGRGCPAASLSSITESPSFLDTLHLAADSVHSSSAQGMAPSANGSIITPVKLIDYDYSSYGPAAFDIANHWCEWAADYHSSDPHVLDYSRFPNVAQQRAFTLSYLAELLRLSGASVEPASMVNGNDSSGMASEAAWLCSGSCSKVVNTSHKQVAALRSADLAAGLAVQSAGLEPGSLPAYILDLRECMVQAQECVTGSNCPNGAACSSSKLVQRKHLANLMFHCCWPARGVDASYLTMQVSAVESLASPAERLREVALATAAASHLHWALWGYVQAKVSEISFDFLSYADQRLEQYMLMRGVLEPLFTL